MTEPTAYTPDGDMDGMSARMPLSYVEEMWPVTIEGGYVPAEAVYAYAEVCLDRADVGCPFTPLDVHVLHPASELYEDGWRLTDDGRFRRVGIRWPDSSDWEIVTDWEGAHQEPPPPPVDREPGVERMIPLYEAKMLHHFDTRWGTYRPDGTYGHLDKP